jgi:TolC family type I secretion outer membrane protein
MKRYRLIFRQFLLFLGLLFLFPPLMRAEAPQPLSRLQAVTIALSRQPRLEISESRRRAADARVGQARSGFLPQLAFSERFSRTNNPMWAFGTKLDQQTITQADFDPVRLNDPDSIDNYVSTFSLTWSLYDSGQTWFGWRQAREGADAARIACNQARQQVISDAAVAYDDALLSRAHLRVVEQAIALAKAHLKLVHQRYGAGFVVKSDLLRAKVRLADLEQKQFEAQSAFSVAMAVLDSAMGERGRVPYRLTDDLSSPTGPSRPLEEWIRLALDRRPELHLLEKQAGVAQNEIKKQRSRHLPSLSLFGTYEINSEDLADSADNYTVGALLQVPLFSGGRMTSGTREARAALAEVEARRRELRSTIRVAVRKAYYEACSARKRIGVAREAVAQAEENHRIVTDRYANGLLTIVVLLDAETAIQDARNHLFQAMHDYRVAHVQLLLASGTLTARLE